MNRLLQCTVVEGESHNVGYSCAVNILISNRKPERLGGPGSGFLNNPLQRANFSPIGEPNALIRPTLIMTPGSATPGLLGK